MAFPTNLTNAVDGATTYAAAHINNLEAKVGIDSSAVTSSHDYKLSGVTGSDKAASKTGSETLTNKTLTSPVLNTSVSGTAFLDEDDMVSDSASKLASQQSIKAYVDSRAPGDGWISAGETFTYASASTFTIAGVDRTAKYSKGTRIKFTQTTAKYFVVVSSSFSTDTTVTVTGGDDYTIANAAITANYYSYDGKPQGFPGWFTFTPTWTGFSANPSQKIIFTVFGNTCFISINANGTSNNAAFNFTIPITAATRNSASINIASVGIIDNSTDQTVQGIIGLASGAVASATAKVGKTFATRAADAYGGFTTSNIKGVEGQFYYEF